MTVLLSLLTAIASPLGRAIGLALVALSLLTGVYASGRVHQYQVDKAHEQAVLVQQQKEADNAIAAANAARAAAEKKYDDSLRARRPGILPRRVRDGSDGFARD